MGQSVVQNGQEVFVVEQDTPITLFVNGVWSMHTEFLVTDDAGNELLRQYVSIGWGTGNGWLDWVAPSTPGVYWFYPDSANRSQYVRFTVVTTGTGGGGGGDDGGNTDPDTGSSGLPSWVIWGGLAVLAVFVLFPSKK